ncbi:DUF2637 domain-containing protein [Streptomyces sp. Inha503]|uniref:DUF2637 domain-containing protein n=1 Tax=Streptomyces sp. Inha503 TaxID=3383314 RepID=UPI0039A00C3A
MNRKPKRLLVLALVAVVGMAFRVSWNALRDVATAIGADETAATLYPIVVDGLMALALIATLVLTKASDRKFALRVLAAYTTASLVLNYVHGLVPELHGGSVDPGRLADLGKGKVGWLLVLLATSLPVGSIYFGSDLVAKVLHHRPEPTANAEKTSEIESNRSMSDLGESADEPPAPDAAPDPLPVPAPVALPAPDPSAPAGAAVAAESARPRRATGRVPESARPARPKRTPAELLDEAREATAGWTDAELTAERIRKEVHTSAEKARGLRDALRAERAGSSATASEAVAV